MTTLKITFYKNIRSVLVLVNHHFLILGGKGRGGVWTEFLTLMMMVMKIKLYLSNLRLFNGNIMFIGKIMILLYLTMSDH
jgi:hypothetical protein